MNCPFCSSDSSNVILTTEDFTVVYDRYPVTALHALVLSRRHVADYFSLSASEQRQLSEVLVEVKNYLVAKDKTIAGFNLGMNCGAVAGQTIDHFHAHVIPRRAGDMVDPRGGVRGVIPEKQKY